MEQKSVESKETKNLSLTTVIAEAIKIPGIRVNREAFLREHFGKQDLIPIEVILEKGPADAGFTQEDLLAQAKKIVWERTMFSTIASFLAGLPGGWAMAATIPADILQFYSVALRMAQELMYLYGEKDLWSDGVPDEEAIRNQLLLYCGVMFGVHASASAVRLMSAALAKQALKKIPQKALTKTFYYPLIKAIAKAFDAKMTKGIFAKGISKAIPIVGGVVSGGLTLVSMRPMGMRLVNTLDKARFNYTEEEMQQDIEAVENITDEQVQKDAEKQFNIGTFWNNVKEKTTTGVNQGISSLKKLFGQKQAPPKESMHDQIVKVKQLLDEGLITEEEYAQIKEKIIAKELKL